MRRKIFLVLLIVIMLLCSACSDANSAPTETIEFYNDFPVFITDLSKLISTSDTIIIGNVEGTLPAELKIEDGMKEVYTPTNIKVTQLLKGAYKPGDTFTIYQLGGIAEGVELKALSNPAEIYETGETYLFFIVNDTGYVLNSEHVAGSKISDGYFFKGKTTEEAVSTISDHIKTEQ